MRRVRCAIYTRKSSEEGLEQEFNSLDAQREACEAYIASQRHEGWVLLQTRYDDGGISGGHLDRPAVQRLMADVDQGRVDQIVVYKIDRLTRSLADFAKLVDRLDAAQASFVSVTQSFNTSTSMGRLTLNVLLSFAQFEREVTAERIRDKIAASKRKGLWMGGYVPLGYEAAGRTLTINPTEANTVRTLFSLYEEQKAVKRVAQKAEQLGLRSKRYVTQSGRDQGGQVMSRGHIHKILTNPLYVGRIAHKGTSHEGQHPAIIETAQWERVQAIMTAQSSIPRGQQNSGRPTSPLAGKLFDPTGARMTPVHTQKRGRRYDYYISQSLKAGADPEERADGWRLPARVLEDRIAAAVRTHLRAAVLHGLVQQADPIWISAAVARIDYGDINALAVIDRVCIGQDRLGITIDRKSLARSFGVSEREVDPEPLAFDAPVSLRRRGVETKLLLDGDALPRDETLIRNIAKGRAFLDLITSGLSAQDIARSNDLSIKRVQQIVEFAFLSPDVVRQIVEGRQPSFLTAEWCLRHEIAADWAVQKSLFSVA
ncbi:MAG: recombinase family protein [Paracoccaceae bacterium]|jgi:site-specific DNA recombinase